jgi:hypothetical protein
MRPEIQNLIKITVETLQEQLKNNENGIIICAVSTAQFINYYIDKGKILQSEKRECIDYTIQLINSNLLGLIPPFILNTLPQMMNETMGYEYEKLISPILHLQTKR